MTVTDAVPAGPRTNGTPPLPTERQLLGMTDAELARVDPVVMNLLVAKGIPSQADLDIRRYQRMADLWAADIARRLPELEKEFRATPQIGSTTSTTSGSGSSAGTWTSF